MVGLGEYGQWGSVELIVGPMYAGKSEELIRRVNRARIAGLKVLVFKPTIDARYSFASITSHNGKQMGCIAVRDEKEILTFIEREKFDVLAIDEGQFFDYGLLDVCQKAANMGKRVIVSGLDMNFRGEPFGVMPSLMAIAEYVTKLTAICMVCKRPASKSQRLVDGKPAPYDDPVIQVGARESYEARCRKCHEITR